MDIASEAIRRSNALDRIVKSAEAIGSELGLNDLASTLVSTHHRVPQYKQLFQLEAVAELLEVVAREIAPDYMPTIDATPTALELAEREGIDLTTVEGKGVDGRILKSDVLQAIDEQAVLAEEKEREAQALLEADEQAANNATPAAIELAKEKSIHLSQVIGTGANGQIIVGDVRRMVGE